MRRIEKFEVRKGEDIRYYKGVLKDLPDNWVEIKTTRGETLTFRKEQIEGRQLIETKGDDTDGKG